MADGSVARLDVIAGDLGKATKVWVVTFKTGQDTRFRDRLRCEVRSSLER
jgi:hypothetical protein